MQAFCYLKINQFEFRFVRYQAYVNVVLIPCETNALFITEKAYSHTQIGI